MLTLIFYALMQELIASLMVGFCILKLGAYFISISARIAI